MPCGSCRRLPIMEQEVRKHDEDRYEELARLQRPSKPGINMVERALIVAGFTVVVTFVIWNAQKF